MFHDDWLPSDYGFDLWLRRQDIDHVRLDLIAHASVDELRMLGRENGKIR